MTIRAANTWTIVLLLATACTGSETPTSSAKAISDHVKPAVQLAAQGATRFEQLVGQQTADPVAGLVTELRAAPGVATARLLEDQATVLVKLNNGSSFSLYTAEASRPEWQKLGAPGPTTQVLAPSLQPNAAGDAIVCEPVTFPQSKKACLITGYQQALQQNTTTIQNALKRAKFDLVSLPLASVQDLRTLRDTLPSCGVIYLSSHGAVAQDLTDPGGNGILSNHVLTEIQIDPKNDAERQKLMSDLASTFGDHAFAPIFGLGAHAVAQNGKSVLSLSSAFFGGNGVTYPNSFVYADVCSSDAAIADPAALQLRAVFEGNGAGAVLGWDGPIATKLSNEVASTLFQGLAPSVGNIDSVQLTITPLAPGPQESYTPSAAISPAQAGIELRLSISGTDGFSRSETGLTDAGGQVTFASVPGGAGGVTDTITVVAGGANNSATAFNVLQKSPIKDDLYVLRWRQNFPSGVANLKFNAKNPNFNLICNNIKLTQTQSVVKF